MSIFNTLHFIWNHPLNANHKLAALTRFVRWQVGSRILGLPVAVDFVDETRLLVATGMHGATMSIYTGLQEFEEMAFVLHFLRQADLFVDVGANVGSFTILASGAVGATTISVEPVPYSYRRLVDNIFLNKIGDKVTVLNVALGKEIGQLSFTASMDTVNHVVAEAEIQSEIIQVPVSTLNTVLHGQAPILLKIDVEGYETLVISGGDQILAQDSLMAVIMELNGSGDRYGFSEETLHKTMLSYGFNTYRYCPFERRLMAFSGKTSKSGNALYIRNPDEVSLRLKASKKYTIQQVARLI